MYSVYQNTCDT